MEIFAPDRPDHLPQSLTAFLAGTIEMGTGEDWQKEVSLKLHHIFPDITVYNPRRKQWDNTIEQSIDNPVFAEQVNWEMDHLDQVDIVIFYFQPGTYSPITLLELGSRAQAQVSWRQSGIEVPEDNIQKIFVCCPPGFWRKGNVEVVCARANIPLFTNIDDMCESIRQHLQPLSINSWFAGKL